MKMLHTMETLTIKTICNEFRIILFISNICRVLDNNKHFIM